MKAGLRTSRSAALWAAAALGLTAAPARADDEPEPLASSVGAEVDAGYRKPKKGIDALFGRPGEVVITGDFSLSFSSTSSDNPPGTPAGVQPASATTTTVVFGPSFDVFVARNFSLGAGLVVAHASQDVASTTSVGLSPRLGYNLPFSESVSWWIRAGISYQHTSYDFPQTPDGAGPPSFSGATFSFVAFAPIEIHLAPHFFVGLGPAVSADLSTRLTAAGESIDGPKQTSYRVQTEVGGYFLATPLRPAGGRVDPVACSSASATAIERPSATAAHMKSPETTGLARDVHMVRRSAILRSPVAVLTG